MQIMKEQLLNLLRQYREKLISAIFHPDDLEELVDIIVQEISNDAQTDGKR